MKKTITLLALLFSGFFASAQLPNFDVTVNTGALQGGYFFFAPYKLAAFPTYPAGTQNQTVIDHNGHIVYNRPVSGYFAGDFKSHWNGLMTYAGPNFFFVMDSTFTIIDSVTTGNGIIYDLHDIIILPNGHYVLLGNEDVSMDLSSYNMFLQNGTPGAHNATVTAGVIQELDTAHNIVYEWHSINNFNFDEADEFFLNDTDDVDWTHMNSVEMDWDSNYIISSRHFDEITKISRSDSTVIWRLGGKANEFTFIGDTVTNDTIPFLAQHDARRLPNGNLLLFDNGRQSPLHPCVAKEYQLDEVNKTATLVWYHKEGDTIFSRSQGNCQRLASGHTLISYGNPINKNMVFNVVDSMNNIVFEVAFPDTQITYRTFYRDSINFLFNAGAILCNGDSLMADTTYSGYYWSTGDTTHSIYVNTIDSFYLYVPVGDSGWISSYLFEVTDSTNICSPIAVSEISKDQIVAYPNPVSDRLYIRLPENSDFIDVFDVTGRNVMHFTPQHDQISIDVNSLQQGMYILRTGKHSITFIKS